MYQEQIGSRLLWVHAKMPLNGDGGWGRASLRSIRQRIKDNVCVCAAKGKGRGGGGGGVSGLLASLGGVFPQ